MAIKAVVRTGINRRQQKLIKRGHLRIEMVRKKGHGRCRVNHGHEPGLMDQTLKGEGLNSNPPPHGAMDHIWMDHFLFGDNMNVIWRIRLLKVTLLTKGEGKKVK
ncbi:hypothetical protein CCACVL1_00737, partial [Corchorus capsularis]